MTWLLVSPLIAADVFVRFTSVSSMLFFPYSPKMGSGGELTYDSAPKRSPGFW